MELTLIRFIYNWYKYKQPRLLDWFRLSTFVSIILNFLLMIETFEKFSLVLVNNVVFVNTDLVFPALLVILVGLLALDLSEFFMLRSSKRVSLVTLKNETIKFRFKPLFYLFTFFIIGIQFYLHLSGVIGYGVFTEHTTASYSFLIQIIKISSFTALSLYGILKYIYKFSSFFFNISFLIIFLFTIVLGFISGMKEEIIIPVILVAIPFLLSGRSISRTILIGGFIFTILLYPINNNYRDVLNKNPQFDKVTAFQLAFLNTISVNFVDNFVSGRESYKSRISLFPVFMYSLDKEGQWNHYKNLDRYIYIPVAWIVPRVFLPNKPISDTGSELYYMTTGRRTNSITPSTFGWSYLEGGYGPTFITFLVFGLVISLFQKRIGNGNIFHLVLYGLILSSLLKVESDIYFRLSGLLQTILISYLIVRIFIKNSKKINHE